MNTNATVRFEPPVEHVSATDKTDREQGHKNALPLACWMMVKRSRGFSEVGMVTVTTYEVRLVTTLDVDIGWIAYLKRGPAAEMRCIVRDVTPGSMSPLGHTHLTLEAM